MSELSFRPRSYKELLCQLIVEIHHQWEKAEDASLNLNLSQRIRVLIIRNKLECVALLREIESFSNDHDGCIWRK